MRPPRTKKFTLHVELDIALNGEDAEEISNILQMEFEAFLSRASIVGENAACVHSYHYSVEYPMKD